MAAQTQISLEEYLRTDYSPDCDYVDGAVEERNVGKKSHSRVQYRILMLLGAFHSPLRVEVWPEQRVQVSPTRCRVPDICVTLGPEPDEEVFTTPPHICVEVLSEDDRMPRVFQKADDYVRFGVHHIWIVDPESERAWIYDRTGAREALDGKLEAADIGLTLAFAEIFRKPGA